MYNHKIPNHLEVEDVFILGLSIRQCVIIGVGAAMAYALFIDVFDAIAVTDPVLGLVMGLVAALVLFGCLLAAALTRLAGRGLDEWLLVFLIYQLRPRIYLWRFNHPDTFEQLDQANLASAEGAAMHEKEAEEW